MVSYLMTLFQNAVKAFISKQLCRLFEIQNGEPELVVTVINPGTTANDLFEFGHGLVQNHQFAGFGIDASGHQFRHGGNDRVGLFGVDEGGFCCWQSTFLELNVYPEIVPASPLRRVQWWNFTDAYGKQLWMPCSHSAVNTLRPIG